MSTGPVNLATFQAMSQANIAAFLNSYFDGNSHAVGGQPYTFPVCTIKFGRQQVPRSMTKPMIMVEYNSAQSKDKVWSGTTQTKIRRDGQWRFTVITAVQGKDNDPDWKTNDQVADLLQLILNVVKVALSVNLMRVIDVGPTKKVPDPKYCFQYMLVIIRSDMVQNQQ